MSESNSSGFVGLLTIVFITLKLCHVIDWSWWLVLLPMIIYTAVVLVAIVILLIIGGGESKKTKHFFKVKR